MHANRSHVRELQEMPYNLTEKSPFCNPKGTGVSRVRAITLKPRFPSTTRMIAFRLSDSSLERTKSRRYRLQTMNALDNPHSTEITTTKNPSMNPYKYPAATFRRMYPHVIGKETTVNIVTNSRIRAHSSRFSSHSRTSFTYRRHKIIKISPTIRKMRAV